MDSFYKASDKNSFYFHYPINAVNQLSTAALLILGVICPLTKDGKEPCFLSNKEIEKRTGIKQRTAYNALKELSDKHIVSFTVSQIKTGGKKRTITLLPHAIFTDTNQQILPVENNAISNNCNTNQQILPEVSANIAIGTSKICHSIYKEEDRNKIERDRSKVDSSFSDFPKSYFLKNCSLDELADICQKYQDDCYKMLAKSLLVDHEFYWPEKDRDCKFERDGSDLEQVIAKDINPLTYLLLEQKYPESEVSKPIVEKIGAAWNDTGTNHIKSFFDGWLAKEVKGLEFAHRADFKGEVFERVNQYIADNVSPVFYGHPVTVYRDSIDKVPEIYTLKGNIQYLRYVVNAYMYIAYNCNPIRYDFGNADAFYQKRTEENIDAIKRICREDFGRELSLDEIR